MTCSGVGFQEIHNLLCFQSKKEKPLSWLLYISIMIYYLWMKLYPCQIRLDNNLSRLKCVWPMDNFWTTKFIQWTIIYKMSVLNNRSLMKVLFGIRAVCTKLDIYIFIA
jgi:hypothetical protein